MSLEDTVRSFLDPNIEGDIDRALDYFTDTASYRVNAWNEPLVGREAIRADFDRQHSLWSDLRVQLVNVATVGNVVFTERIDTVQMAGRDVDAHIVGVFEFDDPGKIVDWREYFDMKEIEAQFS